MKSGSCNVVTCASVERAILLRSICEWLALVSDKIVLCHCEVLELCHADAQIKAWEKRSLDPFPREIGEEATRAEELFRAAGLREMVEDPESHSKDESGQEH